MKKLVFMALLICSIKSFAWDFYGRYVDVERTGYTSVYYYTGGNSSGGTTTLIGCKDPGTLSCPTVYDDGSGNGIPATAQQICYDYAKDKITNGVLTGSTQMNIGGLVYSLSWAYGVNGVDDRIEIMKN